MAPKLSISKLHSIVRHSGVELENSECRMCAGKDCSVICDHDVCISFSHVTCAGKMSCLMRSCGSDSLTRL